MDNLPLSVKHLRSHHFIDVNPVKGMLITYRRHETHQVALATSPPRETLFMHGRADSPL